ncbi:MAG: magnesium and cobalt transport protein CorA, partial [Elusimicrobia bacterium]|nr:magnesium and cobalt transport protein CorA [Elusimicrobiota bacterium]
IYGMNFDPDRSPLNMPELRWYWGYPFALGVMGALAAGLVGMFWRWGWLSKPPVEDRTQKT